MICSRCNQKIRAGYVVIEGKDVCINCRDQLILEEKQRNIPTLKSCPVCHGKVSSAAISCPHCGQPMNDQIIARCPTCQSDNIRKIEMAEKAIGIFAFGLFSGKVGKTMICEDCGYKW